MKNKKYICDEFYFLYFTIVIHILICYNQPTLSCASRTNKSQVSFISYFQI